MTDLVVVSYNSKDYLVNLIKDIKKFTKDYSLTIVDNNSTDGTKDLLAQGTQFCLPVPLKKNEGYAVACNRGAFLGQGEYICFMNSDLKLANNWLDGMLEDMKKNEWVATGPILLDEYGHPFLQRPNWISGACFLIKRSVFEEIDGWDEEYFFYCEDDDICMKLKDKGYKFGLSGVGITHLYNRSPKTQDFQIEHLTKSRAIFERKWKDKLEQPV